MLGLIALNAEVVMLLQDIQRLPCTDDGLVDVLLVIRH